MNVTTQPVLSGPNTSMPAVLPGDASSRALPPSGADGLVQALTTDPLDATGLAVPSFAPDTAFGALLTHRIAHFTESAPDAKAVGPQDDPRFDPALPVDVALVTGAAASPKSIEPAASAAPVAAPDDDDHGAVAVDALGSDLAAQMALASQWTSATANITPRPASRDAPNQRAASSVDPAAASVARSRAADATAPIATAALETRAAPTPQAMPATAKDPVRDELAASASSEIVRLVADAVVGSQPTAIAPLHDAFASMRGVDAPNVVTAMPNAAPTLADALQQRVGTPAWSHEVGHAVLRMATDNLQSASLSVNPDHLGPLDVNIRVEQGTAHLSFNAAHAETRQALESSRAVLEQIFTQQGIALGDCSVSDAPSRRFAFDGDRSQQGSRGNAGNEASGAAQASGTELVLQVRRPLALGSVDTFA